MPEIKDARESGLSLSTAGLLLAAAEVGRLAAGGEPLAVLDARGRSAYNRSDERVEGDLRAAGSRDLSGLIPHIRPEQWLLAYCTCLGDGLAVRVAERLREAGFPRAFAIEGGLDGCRAAGLAIVPKERPYSR